MPVTVTPSAGTVIEVHFLGGVVLQVPAVMEAADWERLLTALRRVTLPAAAADLASRWAGGVAQRLVRESRP
jgi:hypothetical protein